METDKCECTIAGNMGGPFLNEDGSNESEVIAGCDPGIRNVVTWLRNHGFDTIDSGDGKTKFAQGFAQEDGIVSAPHVAIRVRPEFLVQESDRLTTMLRVEHSIEIEPLPPEGEPPRIDASYCPASKVAMILLLNVDDSMLLPERTDRDALITICKSCRRASCWYGEFMCDAARGADTIEVPRSILLVEKREHPSYLCDAKYEQVCGTKPPLVPRSF